MGPQFPAQPLNPARSKKETRPGGNRQEVWGSVGPRTVTTCSKDIKKKKKSGERTEKTKEKVILSTIPEDLVVTSDLRVGDSRKKKP